MEKRVSYYVVDRSKKLEPVNVTVHEGLLIPPKNHALLPGPLEIKDFRRVDDVRSLPVGSIVAEQPNMERFHLRVKKEHETLNRAERELCNDVITRFRELFEEPWMGENMQLVSALSLNKKEEVLDALEKVSPVEADILMGTLKEMRRTDRIFNAAEKIFMEEMVNAVRVRQRL